LIVLESYSNPQKLQVFELAMKKIEGFGFFVSDVISGVALWPFCLGLPSPYDDPTYVTHMQIRLTAASHAN